MINPKDIRFEELIQMYMVANTPSYLFRRFRSTTLVQELGRSSAVDELVQYIVRFLSIKSPSLEETVLCYATTVALASKTADGVKSVLNEFDGHIPSWLHELLLLGVSNNVFTNQMTINIPVLPHTELITNVSSAVLSARSISLPLYNPKVQVAKVEVEGTTNVKEVKLD